MAIRGHKLRFRPTLAQRRYLARAFGSHRFVWNWGLAQRRDAYQAGEKKVGYLESSRRLTALKRDLPWLKDIDSSVGAQALRDLDRAYQNFFAKRARFPKFKSRHNATQAARFCIDLRHVGKQRAWAAMTPLLPGLGTCRIRNSFGDQWPACPKMITVARDACGGYWLSFAAEAIADAPAPEHMIGVDVGITDLAVTSDGWKSGNLNALRAKLQRLRRYQRMVSRRDRDSNRRAAAKLRLARLHCDIANARRDFAHKTSHYIATTANVVVVETLNVKGMLRNGRLARALADTALSELHRQIDYKVARRGGTVIRVERFAPTSKVCADCGHKLTVLPLAARHWTCPCGSEHDRDINAARVMLAIGRGTAEFTRGERQALAQDHVGETSLVEPRIDAAQGRWMEHRCCA